MKISNLFFLALILFSCAKPKQNEVAGNTSQPVAPQAISFSGKPLYSRAPDPAALRKSDSIIAVIKKKPTLAEEDFIEIGRQLVATARYKEAVDNYSAGMEKYPNSFKILRHRGHRYLTLRKLDNVFADLTRAEALIKSQPEVWDHNAAGKPTDTYQHQIWYHLGVYYYLNKSYDKATECFEKSLATAHESNEVVGTTDWLYNSYQRSGKKEKAEKLLRSITPAFNTDREQAYFKRIMLYKGIIPPQEFFDLTLAADKLSIQDVTKLYGLTNWYEYHGDPAKAKSIRTKILQSDGWPAFAYMSAEKDLAE